LCKILTESAENHYGLSNNSDSTIKPSKDSIGRVTLLSSQEFRERFNDLFTKEDPNITKDSTNNNL
jgi:hypothetical protein